MMYQHWMNVSFVGHPWFRVSAGQPLAGRLTQLGDVLGDVLGERGTIGRHCRHGDMPRTGRSLGRVGNWTGSPRHRHPCHLVRETLS